MSHHQLNVLCIFQVIFNSIQYSIPYWYQVSSIFQVKVVSNCLFFLPWATWGDPHSKDQATSAASGALEGASCKIFAKYVYYLQTIETIFLRSLLCLYNSCGWSFCVDDFATLKQIDFIAKASTHRCVHLRCPSEYTILLLASESILPQAKATLKRPDHHKVAWRLVQVFTAGVVSLRVALVLFRSMVVAQVASIANCIPWTLGTVWAWIIIAGNLYTFHENEMCWLFGIRNLGRKAFEGWSWWGLASYSMLRRHQCDMIQETQGLPLSFLQEEETARATSVTKTDSADEFLTEAQEHELLHASCQDFVENDKPRDVVTPCQSHDARDGRRLNIFDPIQSRRCFQWQAQACRCRPRHREHRVQDIRRFDEVKIVGIVTAVGFDGGVTWCNEMCLEPFLDDDAWSDPTVLWLIHDCHTGSFCRTAAGRMACTQDFDWIFGTFGPLFLLPFQRVMPPPHGDQPTTCSQWLLTGGSHNDISRNFSSSVIDSTGLSDTCTVLSFLPSLPSFSVSTLFSMSKSQVAASFYRRPRDRVTQQARDLPNRLDFMQEKGTRFCDDFFCSGWESSHPLGFWSHISVAWFSNNNNNNNNKNNNNNNNSNNNNNKNNNNNNNNNNNVWMEENLRCWQVWRMFWDWLVKMWIIRFLASFARHVLGMFACFLLAYSLSIYPKPPIVQVTDWFGESLGNATWAQIVMQWKAVDVLNAYPHDFRDIYNRLL